MIRVLGKPRKKQDVMKKNVSVLFMLLGMIFVVSLIASNLLETKVIDLFGLKITGGLLLFPISYIINDCIAEVWGFKKARLIIWAGFILNFCVVAIGYLTTLLPAAAEWDGGPHFNFIFGLAPRIALASFLAFLVGSFLNAYVMSKMKVASGGKNFSARAIWSTIVGETADSLIFFPIAFGGEMERMLIMKLMVIQIFLKSFYEVLVLPITIRVVKYVKRVEDVDTFDTDISFNIFKIKDI